METVEMLVKKYSKMGTAQVLAQMGRVTGNAKTACLQILKKRNQDVSEWEEESSESPKPKGKVYEAEPEEELTPKEKKIIENSEKEKINPVKKTTSKKNLTENKVVEKTKSRSVSVENAEISVSKSVYFKHNGVDLTGVVKSIFDSHKTGKEICSIILEDKKIIHKRTNKLS